MANVYLIILVLFSAGSEKGSKNINNSLDDKFIITDWNCIKDLFKKCKKEDCSDCVLPDNIETSVNGELLIMNFCERFENCIIVGACVDVKMTCNSGHIEFWQSCKKVGTGRQSMPYVNLIMIVFTFLCGLHFDKVKVSF